MANARSKSLGFDQKAVIVAVDPNLFRQQIMSQVAPLVHSSLRERLKKVTLPVSGYHLTVLFGTLRQWVLKEGSLTPKTGGENG